MHRATVRYHKLRDKLFARLGGRKCARAGMPDLRGEFPACSDRLEVDHKDGREYEVRELGSAQRIVRYLKELDAGVKLQVLCSVHNGSDGYAKGRARERARRDRRAKRLCAVRDEHEEG